MAYFISQPPPAAFILTPVVPQQLDLESIALAESNAIDEHLEAFKTELRLNGIYHVFLPKNIPRLTEDLKFIEASLLTSLVDNTEDVLNAYNRDFDWKTTFSMKEWRRLQLLMEHVHGDPAAFSTSFSNALWNLPLNQKLPIYVRKQNCSMIFTKINKGHSAFRIETFQPSLPSELVMSTVGSLEMTYPQTVDVTENADLLCSPCFITQIRDLALNEFEASLPKIKKGGKDFSESRDVATPFLVTELLISMLGDEAKEKKSSSSTRITKKVRDTVLWQKTNIPFRRSGLWMTAKVNLQLCLLEEIGEKDAKLIYKMILLRMMCGLCNFRADTSPSDCDLMHQMLAKLGKRAKKLSEFPASPTQELEKIKKNILKDAYQTINSIHSKINHLWIKLSNSTDSIEVVHRTDEEFLCDLNHDARLLDTYLSATNIQPIREEDRDGVTDIIPIARWSNLEALLKIEFNYGTKFEKSDEHLDGELVWMHEVENVDLSSADDHQSSLDIYQLLIRYLDRGIKRYSKSRDHDPVSFSRFVITLMKFYKCLDEKAVKKHPLLKEYKCGIDTSIFQYFLGLDGPVDLDTVDSLEKYFNARNNDAEHESLIYQGQVHRNTFSVRYAKNCKAMKKMREVILSDSRTAIKKKLDQVEYVRKQCTEMEKSIMGMEHTYDENARHVSPCARCNDEINWNKRKRSVRKYERPLPADGNLQWAVVFELWIPTEISCVRDALALINKEVLDGFLIDDTDERAEKTKSLADISKIGATWVSNYKAISEYAIKDIRYPEIVRLGSSTKPVSQCHYNKILDIFLANDDEYVVENGMNCIYYHNRRLKDYRISDDPFAFQISGTNEEKLYKNLQFAVWGTEHTHNALLAEQYLLNTNLPQSEFLAFGSLRSGHRIQLRNLYKFLSEKSLNIEREPVLAIVLQTIWSINPLNPLEQESRTQQVEFGCVAFAQEFLELLEGIVKANSHNWSSPLTMMTSVAIVVQIVKCCRNKGVRKGCAKLLRKCRNIIDEWIQTVEEQLSLVPAQNPEQKKNEQLFLKARIVEMLIASAFSYHVGVIRNDSAVANNLFSLQSDLNTYLKVLSGLNYYVNVEKIHEKLSPFMQLLLKIARHRIPLNLEPHVRKKVEHEWGHSSLVNFVHANWTKLSGCYSFVKNFAWEQCHIEDKQHVYVGRIEYANQPAHRIHVDLIGGSFLIDSYPPTHLPVSISKNSVFQRYFGAQYGENFKVQRDATTFTTTNKINGRHYSFFQAKFKGNLILVCRELKANEDEDDTDDPREATYLELLDSEILRTVIASPLVENYTHWLNPRTKEVYFRKRVTNQEDVTPKMEVAAFSSSEPDYKMVKEKGSWKLILQSSGKYVMSVNSHGFEILAQQILQRMEEWRYINILVSPGPEKVVVTASLPRLGIHFTLEDGHLYSVEYPGYYARENQSKGTLVGLRHGLLLQKDTEEEVVGKKQLIMVPHGSIIHGEENLFHQVTDITKDEVALRQPPFFVYEVDSVLNRLKADKNKSAWLYLAALHAATSSYIPDPLTGLTGTEMAVWILQSGLVWNCAPYDFECKKTLCMIQSFAPVREYYPKSTKGMEFTVWPPTLPSYAAYDGYPLLVRKLVEDSERLQELFVHPQRINKKQHRSPIDIELHSKTETELRLRAYMRHQDVYNKCAHLSDKFLPSNYHEAVEKTKDVANLTVRRNTCSVLQEIAYLRKNPNALLPITAAELEAFLISQEQINGNMNLPELLFGNLQYWMCLSIKADWIRIYNLAVSADHQKLQHHLTVVLCTLAYHQLAPRTQLLNLHYISKYLAPRRRLMVHPLGSDVPYDPMNHQFRLEDIKGILRSTASPISETALAAYHGADWQKRKSLILQDYKTRMEYEVSQLAKGILSLAMTPNFNLNMLPDYFRRYLSMTQCSFIRPFAVIPELQITINEWMRNLVLVNFVRQLDQELDGLYASFKSQKVSASPKSAQSGIVLDVRKKLDAPLNLSLSTYFNPDRMDMRSISASIYSRGQFGANDDDLRESRIILETTRQEIFDELYQSVVSNELAKCVNTCGLLPRLVPIYLLPKLVERQQNATTILPAEMIDHIGGIAVLQTLIKRLNRCIKYEKAGPQMATELDRELENRGHENWSPSDFPEWLLLELDLDVMIRKIQVQVARQMMHMPDGGNGVMQLNMGEGKTSLIVPMLVSSLANHETLCRVTVLQSIFKTNLDLLSNAIGGLLSRRVYVVPCRRDAKIKEYLPKIWQVYRECLEQLGTVLTLSEYRLSPRLMTYEKLLGGTEEVVSFGLELLELEDWLREHCRDILDESDELLSAKYQLIYTTGTQLPLGGGSMRWKTCQNILRLLPQVLHKLWRKYGEGAVEFDLEKWKAYPEQFPACRLLSEKCKQEFCDLLADQIMMGKGSLLDIIVGEKDYLLIKRFITEPETTKELHEAVMKLFQDNTDRLEKVLLISGYLRRGILHLALSKRWRVEYGVDSKGRRQMAVPFRAKDVAAERTEFGHPDVGIVLTHLSYYYSGLRDDQLLDAFMVLKSAPGPESIYQEWIMDIHPDRVDPSIKVYAGINLRDFKQRTVHLFPLLRKNTKVIDFWLSNKVFPKESKVFPRKIVTTAWDLTYERSKHPSTGFSGTCDCSVLLPFPIKQQDLKELQDTNRLMENILKREENSQTVSLPMGVSCREILQFCKQDGARVLIDAGALMLELGNEQVANLWLETDGDIEGVVYFNDKNELLVKVRSADAPTRRMNFRRTQKIRAADIPLEVSPFRERLEKLAVFLDDQHSRGTDLKLPNGFKGSVTVGSRMKRDKLIQAAMRMRKLGSGHSVVFYLSHEVSNKVQHMGLEVVTADILKWATANSADFEKEGLVHWAIAAKNYAQKLAAEDIFQATMNMYPNCSSGRRMKLAGILGNRCVDEEVVDLQEMYGVYLKHEYLVELLEKWFQARKEKLEEDRFGFSGDIRDSFDTIGNAVVAKCQEHIPEKMYLANNFEEEQEKELELEPEHEEIRCVRRHKNLDPYDHVLNQDVKDFVFFGKTLDVKNNEKWSNSNSSTSTLLPLNEIFSDTGFSGLMQPEAWKKFDIFASTDFVRVVQKNRTKDKVDEYLRPISYIVSLKKLKNISLLIISPWEANQLLASFKAGKVHANVKMHLFSPRYFLGQDILLNKPRLQLPTNTPAVSVPERIIAPLLVASGSLFFDSMEEQRAYAWFLGFLPRPWKNFKVEFEALERGWILKTGFLLPKCASAYRDLVRIHLQGSKGINGRKQSPDENENTPPETELEVPSCLGFQEDPSSMVKAILENRHIFVRDSTHVIQLLNKCTFVQLGDYYAANGSMNGEESDDDDDQEADDRVLLQMNNLKIT